MLCQAGKMVRHAVDLRPPERGLRDGVSPAGEDMRPVVENRGVGQPAAVVLEQHNDRQRRNRRCMGQRQRDRHLQAVARGEPVGTAHSPHARGTAGAMAAEFAQRVGVAIEQMELHGRSIRRRQHEPTAIRRHRRHVHDFSAQFLGHLGNRVSDSRIQPHDSAPVRKNHGAAAFTTDGRRSDITLRVGDEFADRFQRASVRFPNGPEISAVNPCRVADPATVEREAEDPRSNHFRGSDRRRQPCDVQPANRRTGWPRPEGWQADCRGRPGRFVQFQPWIVIPVRVTTGADSHPALPIRVPEQDARLPTDGQLRSAIADIHPVDAGVRRRPPRSADEHMGTATGQAANERVLRIGPWHIQTTRPYAADLWCRTQRPVQQGMRIVAVVVHGKQPDEAQSFVSEGRHSFAESRTVSENEQRANEAQIIDPVASVKALPGTEVAGHNGTMPLG